MSIVKYLKWSLSAKIDKDAQPLFRINFWLASFFLKKENGDVSLSYMSENYHVTKIFPWKCLSLSTTLFKCWSLEQRSRVNRVERHYSVYLDYDKHKNPNIWTMEIVFSLDHKVLSKLGKKYGNVNQHDPIF